MTAARRLVIAPLAVLCGVLVVLAGAVLIAQPTGDLIVLLLVIPCLGYVRWRDPQPLRAWPHVAAVVLALLVSSGWCASRCGSYALYQDLAGVPTALAAAALHLVIVLLLVASGSVPAGTAAVGPQLCAAVIAISGGGSLFYGLILLVGRSWCSGCVAIHLLTALQCVRLFKSQGQIQRWATAMTMLAVAGGLNAVYHHPFAPAAGDDAGGLLAYLRSAWPETVPPTQLVGGSSDLDAARRSGVALRDHLLQMRDERQVASAPARSADTATALAGPILRPVAEANRWGSSQAPVTVLVGVDSGCPICAQEFAQLLELRDLVEQGTVQVRFLLSYRTDTAQAMASLSYAGGLVSQACLLDCLSAFYAHQHDILLPADAVAVLPESLPARTAIRLLRSQHAAISTLLADAVTLKSRLGATGDPTLWLETAGSSQPSRTFQGLTLAPILRLAVGSLVPTADAVEGAQP